MNRKRSTAGAMRLTGGAQEHEAINEAIPTSPARVPEVSHKPTPLQALVEVITDPVVGPPVRRHPTYLLSPIAEEIIGLELPDLRTYDQSDWERVFRVLP